MRQTVGHRSLSSIRFNPRICKRCDPTQDIYIMPTHSFNPRICKRCDHNFYILFVDARVSIHASVKDATLQSSNDFANITVSIHASVKDATQPSRSYALYIDCFNPRICKRCDRKLIILKLTPQSFNPRICKRCDLLGAGTGGASLLFQSTHL